MTVRLDFHATPPSMIERMLGAVVGRSFGVVIDPAAGDGRLLDASQAAFPAARAIAVDLDKKRATTLKRERSGWTVVAGDFLTGDLPCPEFSKRLVLMNPPFSGRGGSLWRSRLNGRTVTGSRAMAFLVRAVATVGHRGEVVALVPAGLLTNEKDAPARALLRATGTLAVIAENPPRSFPGVSTRTAIVRWRFGLEATADLWVPEEPQPQLGTAWVTRGALPVHAAQKLAAPKGGIRFIHTRSPTRRWRTPAVLMIQPRHCERVIRRACVLLPRVGAPSVSRVSLWRDEPIVLSDCLFALEGGSLHDTEELHNEIVAKWHLFAAAYGGSCAPFLRLDDVRAVLVQLGWPTLTGPAPVDRLSDRSAEPPQPYVEMT